eukprot:3752400-Rhodomonas_salina.1
MIAHFLHRGERGREGGARGRGKRGWKRREGGMRRETREEGRRGGREREEKESWQRNGERSLCCVHE